MLCVLFFCDFLWEKDCWILAVGSFFSHRAHRVHWAFWRTFRAHRTPPAYRVHRGLSTKISCNVLWYRLTWCLCEPLCVLFFCEKKNAPSWEIERTLWMSKTLTISIGTVKIFQLSCSSLFIERPSLEQKDALLHSRTCLSCTLKRPFLEQEEHILECSSQLSDFVWVVKAIIKYVILLFREYLAEWTVRFFHFSINT